MPTQEQFHVYLTGETLEGHELPVAQQSFARKFKLADEKVEKIFSSSMPFTIKKGVDSKTAEAYKKAIHAMGLESLVEPVEPHRPELELMPRNDNSDSSDHLDAAPQIAASKSYSVVVEQSKVESGAAFEVLYETPESELLDDSMSIGGWLRFFQVCNVLAIVIFGILLLTIVALGLSEGFTSEDTLSLLVSFVEVIPAFVFSILILKIIKDRDEETPFRISGYVKYNTVIALVIFIASMALFYLDVTPERPQSLLGTLIYYYIWTSYFKKSVRVKEYYGSSAG